jgi:hypothetical protein
MNGRPLITEEVIGTDITGNQCYVRMCHRQLYPRNYFTDINGQWRVAERKISDSLSPIRSRLTVCEQALGQIEAKSEKRDAILCRSIGAPEGRITDSLSQVIASLSVREQQMNTPKTPCTTLQSISCSKTRRKCLQQRNYHNSFDLAQ